MAKTSPIALVGHALLIRSDDSGEAIPAGSPAWYAWLAKLDVHNRAQALERARNLQLL
ncbi:MAG TPA: hypothetical protein VFU22_02980 [Roseiflexaceae bacterium]|nr:hypothetical protein [Roseiflexaceae bacterium]